MSEELIEPFSVQEIFVDGFTGHTTRDGVMSCVGYRTLKDGKTVVIRLLWPAASTDAAICDAMDAMRGARRGVH